MAANVKHLSADGATQITSFSFPDVVAGKNSAPVKFSFESISDRVLNNVQIAEAAVGQNDGVTQLRIAIDTVTVSHPYGVTAALTAPGAGGLWSGTGVRGFRLTATNALGETIGSVEVTINIDDATKGVVLNWTLPTGATGIKVYDTDTAGSYPASSLRATLGAVTTYTDLGGARSVGVPPAVNTTAGWFTTLVLGGAATGGVWPSTGTRFWRVAAFDTTGILIGSTLEASVNVDATSKRVTVSWLAFTNAAFYQVYRSLTTGVYTSPAAVGGTTTALTLIDFGSAVITGTLTASPSYGVPPSVFDVAAILVGNIAINQQAFYWATRVVPAGTPEAGNPRLAQIVIQET
jgi:hypothetical protein